MTLWNDSLLVGVSVMDEEHHGLVKAVDGLLENIAKGEGRATIGKTLDLISAGVKQHFASEEQLQAQYGYPNIEAHKKTHEQFIQNIGALVADFQQSGPSAEIIHSINKDLIEELVKHIDGDDRKVGEYICSKGGK